MEVRSPSTVWPTMFTSKVPTGRLGELVESIWLHEGALPAHGSDLRLPTGRVELMVNLREDRCSLYGENGARREFPGMVVAGPFGRAYRLDTAQQSQVMGVVFRAGRARPLLGVPLCELRERHVALEDLWGSDAAGLRERVLAAPDGQGRIVELEDALRGRLERSIDVAHPLAARAAAHVSRAPERDGVGRLAERLGWTARRLEQVFRAEVGLTPKAYQRLQRFRSTLVGIDTAALVGWSAFALERGYCDQAHLIREFRAHAGVSPTTYLRRRGEQLNHVPAADVIS